MQTSVAVRLQLLTEQSKALQLSNSGYGKGHERHAPLSASVGSEAIRVQPGTTMCYVPTFAEFAIANRIFFCLFVTLGA